jgi:serine/threonine protein kinase, bacterial
MKKYFIPVIAVMLIAGVTCRKDKQADVPVLPEKKWIVTTIAGEGTAGFGNGPSLSAKFNHPFGIAVAPDGAVYVTDISNHRIRKIMAAEVTTLAGSGDRGIVNANGSSAQFISPFNIALDANGNLYTSDAEDARIRKITPGTIVSTHAGTDRLGFKDGKVDTAQFDFDGDMVADATGNLYVADPWNNRIRKISVTGDITTIAGSDAYGFKEGNGTEAQFRFPGAIALDRQGNLYVADISNYRIRKITPDGQVTTFAGSGEKGYEDGDATRAQFYDLFNMVIDSHGNLYVGDSHRIRKISPQGIVSTLAGDILPGYVDGDAASAKFNFPRGLAIDSHDNIYIADTYNNRIRKISFE